MATPRSPLGEMNDRSREVFRRLVETYLETGEPVGSRTLARTLAEGVSAATIRNIMQDLEHLGLLDSARTSRPAASRPSSASASSSTASSRSATSPAPSAPRSSAPSAATSATSPRILDRAGDMLSGLTHGASLVLAPKTEAPIRHIEFVSLGPDRALVVLVTADGQVENRLFTPPARPHALGDARRRRTSSTPSSGPHPRRDAQRRRRRDRPPPRRARRAVAHAGRDRRRASGPRRPRATATG